MIGRVYLLFFVVLCFMSPVSHAADYLGDLDIYGGSRVGFIPNVLIIFDNSSSMMCCYDGTDYGSNPANEYCDAWQNTLKNCSRLEKQRLNTAKNAVTNLVDKTTGVKFGLMTFNSDGEGGRMVHAIPKKDEHNANNIGTLKAEISKITTTRPSGQGGANATSKLVTGGWTTTPLAETLAEAGRYFAGLTPWYSSYTSAPWYNSSTSSYRSPIEAECQKNYIILMTDGEPTSDAISSTRLSSGVYDNGVSIGNAGDTSSRLDDVAFYLDTQDCRTDLGSGQFIPQTIDTYPVGFTLSNNLLKTTALMSGTTALTAYNTAQLEQSLTDIIQTVQDENANGIYLPPAIPRNPDNAAQVGDMVYMAFFKPNDNGRWIGNLKAFKLVNGVLKDNGTPPKTATGSDGNILDTAVSYWYPVTGGDGLNVDLGGAGQLLANRALTVNDNNTDSRKVYTYTATPGTSKFFLTHVSNYFDTSNNAVKTAFPGITDAIITNTLNGTSLTRSDDTIESNWRLGAIVHSEPLVKYYADPNNNGQVDTGEPRSYIFVGANDGMLHVFNASDGNEAWAFVPPGQGSRLSLLTSDQDFDYFVDGSPVIETVKISANETMELLMFGERRGGSRYYALDVTNPDEPKWQYEIKDTPSISSYKLRNSAARLGQSWAKPQLKKLKSPAVSTPMEMFLLTGGYDPDRYDPGATSDSIDVGRSIYTVKADTGAVFDGSDNVLGLSIHAGNWLDINDDPYMQDAILDATGFDASGWGYMDRVYAGDLGGRFFAIRYVENCAIEGGCFNGWEPRLLFDLSSEASSVGKKIMTKPEVTLEIGKECAYFGTGDRENPAGTDDNDAIYAVCNAWPETWSQPLTTSDIEDITDNYVQDPDTLVWSYTKPTSVNGWSLKLEHDGEKLVSSPKLLNKVLYFTTFTPGTDQGNDCNPDYSYGTSRLYAVDYLTGEAVYNFYTADQTGDEEIWTKKDRYQDIGTSIAGEVVLASDGTNTSLYYGSGGKFQKKDVDTDKRLKRYYWRQIK